MSSLPETSLRSTIEEKDSAPEPIIAPSNIVSEFKQIRSKVVALLKDDDYETAKQLVNGMFEYLQEDSNLLGDERLEVCDAIDGTLEHFYRRAFAVKGKSLAKRRTAGMELLQSQLSSTVLDSPYNTVPKQTLLNALKALTRMKEVRQINYASSEKQTESTDEAYRLLQRLVTGVGIRQQQQSGVDSSSKQATQKLRLYESDFNMVLNAYSNVGRMEMAHRVVALQERTPHAPVLSAVAYSILLKGYGKLRDINNVEMLLTHAKASQVEPDLIMVNSLLDAYINCNEWSKAKEIFECIRKPNSVHTKTTEHGNSQYEELFYVASADDDNSDSVITVTPNKRTYNIMMKGYASKGLLIEALELAREMEHMELWDHVTTNTLVQAAVNAKDLNIVEEILERHTEEGNNSNNNRHPNAEAYTSAIDGYAKVGELQAALDLLKTMDKRGVPPNEFAYTCLVGALARKKLISQAEKMIDFMKSSGLKVGAVTYNAFISGLVDRSDVTQYVDGDDFDRHVDAAIKVLRTMMKDGIKPTPVTVSILVDAFGKCDNPRLVEAVSLVRKLEGDDVIRTDHIRVLTALIQVYGASGDLSGAGETFDKISNPDIAAVNAYLNACLDCEAGYVASDAFDQYFRNPNSRLRPDVISYSIMITMELQKQYSKASKRARILYEEMKFQRRLQPDKALVDM